MALFGTFWHFFGGPRRRSSGSSQIVDFQLDTLLAAKRREFGALNLWTAIALSRRVCTRTLGPKCPGRSVSKTPVWDDPRSSLVRTTYVESPSILVPFSGTRAFSWGASPSKVRDTWAMSASEIPSIGANATIVPSLTSEKIGRNGSSPGRNGTSIRPVGPPERQADLSLFIGCGIRQLSPHDNIRVFAEIITALIQS
jgi:hypothetical protein